ncbi:MAG: hypothetical protein U0744_10180 [Gemmataceae bacterium]
MLGKGWSNLASAALLLGVLVAVGCNQPGKEQAKGKGDAKSEKKGDGKKEITKEDTKHDSWWCQEHGVPESMCSLCSDTVAAKHKKEGDWCDLHDRAKSQCFKCDPSKYAKYEAMYVAKYGKAPERPPEEEFKK